ncbi:uncharacterized protein LOC107038567 [Diachasma alloeum]|uniref:uncharacterized protein LOC107038567 n=1 Tax=Diachasma alloeum TaxID=454923 RepID=UPI00073832ED|nr:uncharacterized protein LOC107038567 [Diachasma alloeum]
MAAAKCPERDPCEGGRDQRVMKDRKMTDAERLEKLENEVTLLRNDFDRMRWEQAVAETAIGRAIIRGSASLGNGGFCPVVQSPGDYEGPMKNRQLMDDPQKNPCAKMPPQLPGKNAITDGKPKQGKEECGYFTLG